MTHSMMPIFVGLGIGASVIFEHPSGTRFEQRQGGDRVLTFQALSIDAIIIFVVGVGHSISTHLSGAI